MQPAQPIPVFSHRLVKKSGGSNHRVGRECRARLHGNARKMLSRLVGVAAQVLAAVHEGQKPGTHRCSESKSTRNFAQTWVPDDKKKAEEQPHLRKQPGGTQRQGQERVSEYQKDPFSRTGVFE